MQCFHFKIQCIVIFFLSVIDLIFTLMWIRKGLALEANPLLLNYVDFPVSFAFLKLGMTLLCLIILWRYRNELLSQIGIGICSGVYFVVLWWHVLGMFIA